MEEGIETTPDRQYTWGLRDRWDLIRRKRTTTNPLDETLYVLRDYLDPVAIVGTDGTVLERYAYDAFGNVRFLDQNYGSRTNSSYAWDFLFHGEFRDPETKLYNYGHRYYDTGLGRWLSRDPIGERGGVNLYGMVGNDSVNRIDSFGLRELSPQEEEMRLGRSAKGFEHLEHTPTSLFNHVAAGAFRLRNAIPFGSQEDATTEEAMNLFNDFESGGGSSFRLYGQNSNLTRELRSHRKLAEVRRQICALIDSRCDSGNQTPFDVEFSVGFRDLSEKFLGAFDLVGFAALKNVTPALLGSFLGKAWTYNVDCNKKTAGVLFSIWNKMSLQSWTRDPLTLRSEYSSSPTAGPYRTIHMEFYWQEITDCSKPPSFFP